MPVRPPPSSPAHLWTLPGGLTVVFERRLTPGFAFDLAAEVGTILGFARGGGGYAGQGRQFHAAGKCGKAFQRRKGARPAFRVELAGFGQTFAEARHDLFIVEIGRAACRPIKDYHPDRVRADINHAHPLQRAGGGVVKQGMAKRNPILHRKLGLFLH